MSRTIISMRTTPPVTLVEETLAEVQARAEAWRAQHPGYDATNYVDAYRDANGELVESQEFYDIDDTFAALAAYAAQAADTER